MLMLRLLVALAEEGSISGAARRVGAAQSNASRSLKLLESLLVGESNRSVSFGATLNDRGSLAALWVQGMAETRVWLALGVKSLNAVGGGHLSVGALHTVVEHLTPTWLGVFYRRSRSVSIDA